VLALRLLGVCAVQELPARVLEIVESRYHRWWGEYVQGGGALDEVGLVGARCVKRGGGASLRLLAATGHGVRSAEECPEGEHGELEEES